MHALLVMLLLQTPNIGGVFATPQRPTDSPHSLALALTKYHEGEKALFAQKVLPAREIVDQWQKLRPLRRRLERMATSGRLARLTPTERSEMRRALTGVVEHSIELVYVTVDELDPRVFDADEARTVELLHMALIGNQWLGLEVQDIFGIPVEGGVS